MSDSSTNESVLYYEYNDSSIFKDFKPSGDTNLLDIKVRDDKTDFYVKKIASDEKESNVDFSTNKLDLPPKTIESFEKEMSEILFSHNYTISNSINGVDDFQIKKFDLTFSSKIKHNLFNDQNLRRIITIIEKKLRELAEDLNLILDSKIYYEEDWESPELLKIILFINFINITFDEKLEFWSKFSISIRESLVKMQLLYKYQLKDFLERFYLKIDIN